MAARTSVMLRSSIAARMYLSSCVSLACGQLTVSKSRSSSVVTSRPSATSKSRRRTIGVRVEGCGDGLVVHAEMGESFPGSGAL